MAGTAGRALGAWILKTQLDSVEGMTRSVTDILTGSPRVRPARGDIRAVYYSVLALVVVESSLSSSQPIMLLQIGATFGAIFVIASLHLLYLNTRVLPKALRPPLWRRLSLIARPGSGVLSWCLWRSFMRKLRACADLDAAADFDEHRVHVARPAHTGAIGPACGRTTQATTCCPPR